MQFNGMVQWVRIFSFYFWQIFTKLMMRVKSTRTSDTIDTSHLLIGKIENICHRVSVDKYCMNKHRLSTLYIFISFLNLTFFCSMYHHCYHPLLCILLRFNFRLYWIKFYQVFWKYSVHANCLVRQILYSRVGTDPSLKQ